MKPIAVLCDHYRDFKYFVDCILSAKDRNNVTCIMSFDSMRGMEFSSVIRLGNFDNHELYIEALSRVR
jgi:hypothetical protein